MTTYSRGADPEALARTALTLRALQAELTRIEATSRASVGAIRGSWGGDNLLSLTRRFTSTTLPSLQACAGVLDAMAARLDRNAAAQRSASGVGIGPGPGAAGGGVGGSGRLNDVTRTKGKTFGLDPRTRDDSVDDLAGNHYRHTVKDGLHSYELSRADESGRQDYERWTHAGDHRGPLLEHERGWRTESARKVDRPWLPTDDSKDPAAWSNRHPTASELLGGALTGVSWTERTDHVSHTDYEKTYLDEHGNVTDKEHAVQVVTGGGPGTELTSYTEYGVKDGALMAGAGTLAGAYLVKGSVEGNLGDHGKYTAAGFVGAEAKASASASLGKDGLVAKAGAEAFAGARGDASVAGDYGLFAGHAAVSGMAGAEAKADASVGIGKDGVSAKAGASAFAGAKAGAELGASVAGIGGTVGGEVYAGIGGHANIDAALTAESVKVKVDVGAAVGVGAGVKFSVDVQPKELLEDVGLGDAAGAIGTEIKDPMAAIGRLFG